MSGAPIIVWFRNDLRLADNPALHAASQTGRPIIPLFVFDPDQEWAPGGASRWWLHHSLQQLGATLAELGSPLILRRGDSAKVLEHFVHETGAQFVYWNRLYEPGLIARDAKLKSSLRAEVKSFNASLLREPWELKTGSGTPFRVFTPFYRALSVSLGTPDVLPSPKSLLTSGTWPSDDLLEWRLTPSNPDWASGFHTYWTPGEIGARKRLDSFLSGSSQGYAKNRDFPGIDGTSRLSPHLHFGEIGPRQIWRAAMSYGDDAGLEKFKSELAWREFAHHLLFHFPELPNVNLKREFDAFPWRDDNRAFEAWTKGRTGFPIVDAGMRELWSTGWMHNRVRMIVASFLVKNLMIDWRQGARWFWDTLVDADLANNSASWQWVAGCGADAAPFFRVFNPILQGQKFDPDGAYVRHWIPELARLDHADVHAPWQTPASKLSDANVELGKSYPLPIVDLATTRNRALAAFTSLKSVA